MKICVLNEWKGMSVIMNYGIILSGGVGSRLKEIDIPKQYYSVCGRSILSYCLENVERASCIDAYLVVAAAEWQDFILHEIRQLPKGKTVFGEKIKFGGFALPGENRQLSILHGLYKLKNQAKADDIILIQDAVRPLTSELLMTECIRAAKCADGAMPVLRMTDTVYYSKNGKRIDALLERDKILAGQAPEAFVYGKYMYANEALTKDEILSINGSSEPAIKAGMQIALVKGDEHNFKITTAEDLEQFERILEGNSV